MELTPFIVSGLATGSAYALSGVGLTVLYRTTGVINFAYGALGALGALVGWQLLQDGAPQPVAWVAAIGVATAVSLAYGLFVAPRLALRDPTTNAAATLGLALLLLGFTRIAWSDDPRAFGLPSDDWSFPFLDVQVIGTQVLALALAVGLTALVGLYLARGRTGLNLRAMAADRELSGMLGVRVTGTGAIAWAACGALAGISGLLLATLVRLDAATLTILVVPAVAAAIVGRLESLPLVCVGGISIGVLEAAGTPYDAVADYRSIAPLLAAGLVLMVYQWRGSIGAISARGAAEAAVVSSTTRTSPVVIVVGVLVATALIPSLVGVAWLATLTACVLFAVCAAGIGLLYDRLGLTSLAQVALMGLGGWTMLRLHFATDWPFVVLLVLTAVITAAIAVLLGLPALRLRGLHLALVTLMIAAGFDVAFNAAGFPNGGSGFLGYQASGELQRLPRPGFAESDAAYFRLTVIVAGLLLSLVWLHLATRPGRSWALIKAGERAAASAGVSVVRMQSWAFALAGLLSGAAGALLAGQLGQLAPASFPVSDSLLLFGLVVIAGAHHWSGWIVAALLYKAVPFAFDEAGIDGNYATMIFGVALMLSMLGSERGIVGDIGARIAAVRARRAVVVP